MKKAKIILSAAGLLSIIAGAFAFKAQHKFGGGYKCLTANKQVFYAPTYTTLNGTTTIFCTVIDGDKADAIRLKVSVNS